MSTKKLFPYCTLLVAILGTLILVAGVAGIIYFRLGQPSTVNNLRCTCVEVNPSDAAPKPEKP